ncbi:MAG: histidine phosphatase family protein [Brachymonas sp.]|nr:histidine phosphatase family protein [Brachymonas sp.]
MPAATRPCWASDCGAARWYLLRHAQPMIAPGVCYGQLDVAADVAATAQAAAAFAAHWQAAHASKVEAGGAQLQLLASPLQRCQQLAQRVLRQLGPPPPQPSTRAPTPEPTPTPLGWTLHTHAGLAEIHFGAWEGVAWNDLPAHAWQAWMSNFAQHQPTGGESLAQLLQRVLAAAQHTAQWLRQQPQGVAVWVTHAGVMRALHWLLQHGHALPASADQWPQDGACDYGQWLALDAAAVEGAVRQLLSLEPLRSL